MFLGSRRYRSIALLPLLIQCAIQMAFPSSLGGAVEPCDPECDESHEICVNSTCVECMTSDMNGMCNSPYTPDVCCKGLICRAYDCCDPTEGEGSCCVGIDNDCSDFPEDCCEGSECNTTSNTCVECIIEGKACSGESDTTCCSGLVCQQSTDGDGTYFCVHCPIAGESCSGTLDCCTGYSRVNDLCCANQGTVCSGESDTSCCSGYLCLPDPENEDGEPFKCEACADVGNQCYAHLDTCCSGLVCQQSTDGDGTYFCVHCPIAGESCSGELDCCNGYACMFSSGQDFHLECCGVSGGICATNDSCCQGHLCIDSTCCSELLFSCRTDEDCCGSGVCLEDTCYVGESGDCNTETDNCCSGHVCRMSVDGSENGNGLCVSGAFSQFNRKHGLALPLMASFGFLGYFLFVLL